MKIFTHETAGQAVQELKEKLDFPYINVQVSTLGGQENVCILMRLSEQAKEKWAFEILHNSPYRMIRIDNDGTVDNFSIGSGLKKIRRFVGKDVKHIIEKINKAKSA